MIFPPNTDIVKLTYGRNMRAGTIYFAWMDTTSAPYPETYPDAAELVELDTSNSSAASTAKTWEYEVAEGANSFAIIVLTNSSDFTSEDTPEGIAAAREIVVKCCAAAEEST